MVTQNKEDIQDLLCEVRSGDRAGAGDLAVIVRRKIYPFILGMIADPDTAEDVAQDTLLSVLLNLRRLRNNEKFWPWVYRIAKCRTRDHIRKRRLRSAGKSALALDCAGRNPPQDESVLEAKIYEEKLRQVSDGVDQLSYEHRDIIRLRYYEQLTYEQIALRAQISPRVARSRSFRARKCLKACLV